MAAQCFAAVHAAWPVVHQQKFLSLGEEEHVNAAPLSSQIESFTWVGRLHWGRALQSVAHVTDDAWNGQASGACPH